MSPTTELLDRPDGFATLSRRQTMLGLVGAAACQSAGVSATVGPRSGLIDIHHHIRPPGVSEYLARLMAGWSAQAAIEGMDRCGISAGIAYPGPVLDPEISRRAGIARAWNEFGADLARNHKGRFGLFASLPLPDVAACMAEIDHSLDVLHADGFGIATSYDNKWLGDEAFWPIYEKMHARNAVVFVHPADAACCSVTGMGYARPPIDGSWVEWPMNTARTILSLITSGTARRFNNIKFIFAHGGGVMPLLIQRIIGLRGSDVIDKQALDTFFPKGIDTDFRNFYFECAQASTKTNMNALRSLVPDTQLLFGSDFPFFPLDYATHQFSKLELSSQSREAIARRNAQALLPRWS